MHSHSSRAAFEERDVGISSSRALHQAEPNDRMGWVSLALGMAKQGTMIA